MVTDPGIIIPLVGAAAGILSVLLIAWVGLIIVRALGQLKGWITPDSEGATPMGSIIEGIARTAVQSRQNSEAADASAAARRMIANKADLIQEQLTENNPALAAGASMVFGKQWAKKLAQNPELLAAALDLGPKILGGLGGKDTVDSISDLAKQFGAVSKNVTNGRGSAKPLSSVIPTRR